MTDDRALLEAAARAAGMDGYEFFDEPGEHPRMRSPSKATPYGPARSYWSPLSDDGDALRLAAYLKITISQPDAPGDIDEVGAWTGRTYKWVPRGDDPYAATRRAIVMAAAAMAKT